ncbi:MAG TPA: response regulator transcription factor [Niabella sp.]|nr:response regulator transcription factor [Niabella sp.]HUN01520.1 response regulator transcription factor [Niabella sp.]
MERYNIIIADDHYIIIDGIKSVLQNTPFIITAEAKNGQEALDIITQNPKDYQVLISDIGMPVLSGTELCKIVKQNFPHIKVLMLSMYGSELVIEEALKAGTDGFVLKNSGKTQLLQALKNITANGNYYSDEIIPVIYGHIKKEKSNTLTPHELEILKLIVQEFSREQIADKLCISIRTVDNHRIKILEKTGCSNTIALVKYAINNNLV